MGQQQGTCGTAKSSLDWFVMEERAAKQSLNGLSARVGTTPGELRESFELPIGAILASNRRYPTVDDQFWIAVLATLRDSHITLLLRTFVICRESNALQRFTLHCADMRKCWPKGCHCAVDAMFERICDWPMLLKPPLQ